MNETEEPKSKYDWLLDMKQTELRAVLKQHEGDMLHAYDKGGIDLVTALWEHLAGIPVYPSKKAFYKLAAMYVRQHYDPADSAFSKKMLAARIGVSLRFVELALATTDKTDVRQIDAFEKQAEG
ncbi:MAG: hypothetical protein AABZ15_11715 [Nitrospirota bacterium]